MVMELAGCVTAHFTSLSCSAGHHPGVGQAAGSVVGDGKQFVLIVVYRQVFNPMAMPDSFTEDERMRTHCGHVLFTFDHVLRR
ncbi:MAG: hypothetical protein NVS2B7_10240 [Herpetosiphon sp.]